MAAALELVDPPGCRNSIKVCDRAYIISEGEILLAGKPGEIAASDRVREIYLGDGFSL